MKKKEKDINSILAKIAYILSGILITISIFAFTIKTFGEIGVWLSLIINGLLIFAGFYYIEKGSIFRTISWSMLITIILSTTLYFFALSFLFKTLEGF